MNVSLEIKNLSAGYDGHPVLSDLNLSIPAASFTALTGPNGCGKSTLLKTIIRELIPEKGSILIDGKDSASLKRTALARLVSFVGQKSDFAGDLTVREAVSLGRFCHGDEKSASEIIEKSMEETGISFLQDRPVCSLSGGEYQLLMISRALCQDTPVMLLDEITNNLDPRHEIQILQLMKKLSSHKTVLCVMHNLNDAFSYSDYTAILNEGKVFSFGKTKEVLTKKNVETVFGVSCSVIRADDRQLLTVY